MREEQESTAARVFLVIMIIFVLIMLYISLSAPPEYIYIPDKVEKGKIPRAGIIDSEGKHHYIYYTPGDAEIIKGRFKRRTKRNYIIISRTRSEEFQDRLLEYYEDNMDELLDDY